MLPTTKAVRLHQDMIGYRGELTVHVGHVAEQISGESSRKSGGLAGKMVGSSLVIRVNIGLEM